MCEELFLLLTADDGKAVGAGTHRGIGLTSAVLTDLVVAGRVTVTPKKKDVVLTLADAGKADSPILDAAVARLRDKGLQSKGRKFSTLVQDGKLDPQPRIVAELTRAGVIGVEEKRMLGLVPARYPVLDPRPEAELRRRLRRVLSGAETATVAEATELSILQALGVARKVLGEDAGSLGNRELKQRIQEVAVNVPAGDAVARAIQSINSAVLTAVIIPVVVSGGSN